MSRDESGGSLIEVTVLGVAILAPLIWGLMVLSGVHEASLAATAAVREAGTEAARAANGDEAVAAIKTAVTQAFVDQGIDPSSARVDWFGTGSFDRGGRIEIVVEYPVPVARAPFVGSVGGPAVWVKASHVAQIDPYASRP